MLQMMVLIFLVMTAFSAQADVTRSAAQERIHAAREAHHKAMTKAKSEDLEAEDDASKPKEVYVVTRDSKKKKTTEEAKANNDKETAGAASTEEKEAVLKTREECAAIKNVKEKAACFKALEHEKKKFKESSKSTTKE